MEKKNNLGAVLLGGLFVGATIGIIAKFVTDKENIKYAATGGAIGAIISGAIYLIKKG